MRLVARRGNALATDTRPAVVEALNSMTRRQAGASPFIRCLVDVAPVVIAAAVPRPSFVADLLRWVHQVEMDTPAGRRAAAEVFDETLRAVVGRGRSRDR